MDEIETIEQELSHGVHASRRVTFEDEGQEHELPWIPIIRWDDRITGSLVNGGELFTSHLTPDGVIHIEASNGDFEYEVTEIEEY